MLLLHCFTGRLGPPRAGLHDRVRMLPRQEGPCVLGDRDIPESLAVHWEPAEEGHDTASVLLAGG